MSKENNYITDKRHIKAGLWDFLLIAVSFFTVFTLSVNVLSEQNITVALLYLFFLLFASAYIVFGAKTFRASGIVPGCCCIGLAVSFAFHSEFICIPLLMVFSAIYALSLRGDLTFPEGSYLYIFDFLGKIVFSPLRQLFMPLRAIYNRIKLPKQKKVNIGFIFGLIIALPLVALLTFLLAKSDAAFEYFVDDALSQLTELRDVLFGSEFTFYAIVSLIFSPYIISVLFSLRHNLSPVSSSVRGTLKRARVMGNGFLTGFLGCVCLLYTVYLLSQLTYFFSAFTGFLPDGTQISLAKYARRGFFDMSAVAVINLCLISAAAVFTKRKGESFPKAFKAFSLFLCGFTVLLIFAAMYKMAVYIDTMGLTQKRLAVSVFNIFLLLTVIFIVVRLFRKAFPYFRCIMLSGMIILTAFMLMGSGGIIAEYNTSCYLSGKHESLDIELIAYRLGDYNSAVNLARLTDDPLYGNEAKSRLWELYSFYEDMEPPRDSIDTMKTYSFLKEHPEFSQWSYIGSQRDYFFCVNTEKEIVSINLSLDNRDTAVSSTHGSFMNDTVFSIRVEGYHTLINNITVHLDFADGTGSNFTFGDYHHNVFHIFEIEGEVYVEAVEKTIFSHETAKEYFYPLSPQQHK